MDCEVNENGWKMSIWLQLHGFGSVVLQGCWFSLKKPVKFRWLVVKPGICSEVSFEGQWLNLVFLLSCP